MSRPVLYDYPRSTASYRVRIALNLKGVDYDAVSVNLLEREHTAPEHLTRNPQGFVPALTVDGATLTQSLAILRYLDARWPDPHLFPADPLEHARVEAVAHAIAMDVHPVCNLSVATTVMDWVGGDDDRRASTRLAWMQRFITRGLDAVEALLPAPAPYAFGAAPTVADVCLVAQLYNARRWDCDLSRWPRIQEIEQACARLDAFARAHPEAAGA